MDVDYGRFSTHIKTAIRASAKARHRHRLGAVLTKGNKILSVGHNLDYIHAEHSAINRAWRSDIEGATLIVVRVLRNGALGIARPCSACMSRMAEAGIKKVMYSDSNGGITSERLIHNQQVRQHSIKYIVTLWYKQKSTGQPSSR